MSSPVSGRDRKPGIISTESVTANTELLSLKATDVISPKATASSPSVTYASRSTSLIGTSPKVVGRRKLL